MKSFSALVAKVQELHGSEVCLTKLKVIERIFDNNDTVHMCEASAKYVIAHLWNQKC